MQHQTLITTCTNYEHLLGEKSNESNYAHYLFNNRIPFRIKKPMNELHAYCVTCKSMQTTQAFQLIKTDSGRGMAFGQCPLCDGKIQRILGTLEHQLGGAQ
jgi:hypothetical protein